MIYETKTSKRNVCFSDNTDEKLSALWGTPVLGGGGEKIVSITTR